MASLDRDIEWDKKLWQACVDGDLVAVNEAIRKGADLNWKKNELHTPLHVAIYCEHEQIVKVLLDHDADPNTISEDDGYTPLMTACEKGSRNLVGLLLEYDAKPYLDGTAESALHVAVACDKKEIAKLLLATKVINVDKRNKENETPLHVAAKHGHTEMIHYLISKKANIDEKNSIGYTAFHYAAIHNHPNVIELLLDKGAKPDTLSKNGFSPLISAAKSGSREIVQQLLQWNSSHGRKVGLFQNGPNGNSALHFASDQAQLEVVKLLVVEGNLNKLNQDGDTPLHLASRKGHVHVVQLLVNHKAKLNIQNKEGKTPVQLAEENDHDMAKAVLNKKLPVSKQHSFKQEDPLPCTQPIDEALWEACYENKKDQIRTTLSQGANQNWRNEEHNNFSCLEIAVFCNHTEAEKILLENVNQAKESALHLAASYGRTEAAESLLNAGAVVDAVDEDSNTPLHNAAAYGHLDTVKLLVQKRASLKRRNKEQLTPLDVAKKRKRFDVMKFLEENESSSSPSSTRSATELEAILKAEMEKRNEVEAELQQFKAEMEKKKEVEAELQQLKAEMEKKKEVEAELQQFKAEMEKKKEVEAELKQLKAEKERYAKELQVFRSKVTSIQSADTCSPEMKDLVQLKLNNGSLFRTIDSITIHSEDQCVDFAQMLLKDAMKVKGLTESYKEEKGKFVRAVLTSWTGNTDRSWRDLIEAMSAAALDKATVKTLQDNFYIN